MQVIYSSTQPVQCTSEWRYTLNNCCTMLLRLLGYSVLSTVSSIAAKQVQKVFEASKHL